MSALATLSRHRIPLSSMTDEELENEHEFWSDELSSLHRWDSPTEVAVHAMEEIETEQRGRRVAALRAEEIAHKPFIVDDPGVRPREVSKTAPVILMGAAKTRAEWKPSRIALAVVTLALAALLIGAAAMAGQRLSEIDTRYGWEIV